MVEGLTPRDKNKDFKDLQDEVMRLRNIVRFTSPSVNATDSSGFGFGSKTPEVAPISGLFALEPVITNIGIELGYDTGVGELKTGDLVTSSVNGWTGKFVQIVSGNQVVGVAVFDPQNTTAFSNTDPQTLSVSGGWSAAYLLGTNKEERLPIRSSSIVVDDINANYIVQTIIGTINNGQFLIIKPIDGTTLTLTTGGNIDISDDLTIADNEIAILQFHEDNKTPDVEGNYNVLISSGGGGVAGTIIITPTNEVTSPGASEDVDLSLFQHYVFHLSANLELTLINPPTTINRAEQFILEFIQDGVGSRTITVTNLIHPSVPVIDGTANSRSVIVGFALNDLGNNKRFDMYLVGS